MKDLHKFYLYRALYEIYLWGVIAIPFYISSGYSLEQGLQFIAAYGLMVILWEFPTGVLGDIWGNKSSLILGLLLTALGFSVIYLNTGILMVYLGIFVLSIGNAFSSGADTAMLKSISNDFRNDLKTYNYTFNASLLISYAVAGFIAELSYTYAFGIMVIANLIGVMLLLSIKDTKVSVVKGENVIRKWIGGIKASFNRITLFIFIFLMSYMGALRSSGKTILGSFEEVYGVDLKYVGLLIAMTVVAQTVGVYMEKYLPKGYRLNLFILAIPFVLLFFLKFSVYTVGFYFVALGLVEANHFKLKNIIIDMTPHSVLSSVLSAAALFKRAMASILVLGIATMTDLIPFHFNFVLIGIVCLLLIPIGTYVKHRYSIKY